MTIVVAKFRETLRKFPRYSLASVKQKFRQIIWETIVRLRVQASAFRCFLEEIHTYTELVDGFRNIIDKQRHVVERLEKGDLNCLSIVVNN